MKKYILITLLLNLVIMEIEAQAKPKFVVMNAIKQHANYALGASESYFLSDNCDYSMAEAFMTHCEEGLASINDAQASGVVMTETITLDNNEFTGKNTINLTDAQESFFKIMTICKKKSLTHKITQKAMNCDKWLKDVMAGTLDAVQAELLIMDGGDLKKLLVECFKNNITDLNIKTWEGSYNMAELRELADYCSNAANKQMKALMAKKAAFDKPFLDALTGDRKNIFQSEFAGNEGMWACYGSGMKELKSAADLKSAAIWYTWGHNTSGIVDVWHITGYQFSGDKLTKRLSYNGLGLRPAAGNFK